MRLLLHICCAPCACYCVSAFRDKDIDITGFWHNPNIHPWTEYRRRLGGLREFAEIEGLSLLEHDEYPLEKWLKGAMAQDDDRCIYCYRTRLITTAQIAKAKGFDAFSTTLLYSKHQKHQKIIDVAKDVSNEEGIEFLYQDLRKGWKEGVRISKQLGLYRQKYCGCIFSEKERYLD